MAVASFLRHIPGRYWALAISTAMGRAVDADWRGSKVYRWFNEWPHPEGFLLQPRDFRATDVETGRQILMGIMPLAGTTLHFGVGGDPWDRPSPSRAFAEALHRFDWLPHLMATGPDGCTEALRLILEWRRLFGRWNRFSWTPAVMAGRVYNLACAAPTLTARASEAEVALIAGDLARQARDLLGHGEVSGAATRAAAVAVAGAALKGSVGTKLLDRGLKRLASALALTLPPSGGHAKRTGSAALELLFDLQTVDDAMVKRGRAAPDVVQSAIARLATTIRFLTLEDGGLATGQGGSAGSAAYVSAARARDETGDRPMEAELGGYLRMESRLLQLIVDAAPPPSGVWAIEGVASPLAIQVLAQGRRLIDMASGVGVEAASSIQVGEKGLGHRLTGLPARVLGPRLVDADYAVEIQRHEAPGAVWLDLAHHGWMARYRLMHQRRLYLDLGAGDLRGEDRLTPTAKAQGPDGRHFVPYALRFQLYQGVRAMVSQDRRSALIKIEGASEGWTLRNDLLDIEIEPSARTGRPSEQLVLRGLRRADSGARVRWRLSPARTRVDGAVPAA